jgi:hypothetical protein
MHMAFRSIALDIIMEYVFARSYDAISAPHFRNIVIVSIQKCLKMFLVMKHFPMAFAILDKLPGWLTVKLSPSAVGLVEILNTCERHADEVLSDPREKLHNASHEIIYHHLVTPDLAKHDMPSKRRLSNEANSLLTAGSETVGGTCTIGTFYVVNDRKIWNRLRAELDEARKEKGMGVKESLEHEDLEKLPYLTAVIKESLRLNYGLVTPLPRVVGPGDSVIGGYVIPKGVRGIFQCSTFPPCNVFPETIVGISSTFLHNDPSFFPDPFKFDPERWLKGAESKALEKWLVPFSTGPRQCLGVKCVFLSSRKEDMVDECHHGSLAWAELYLIFGNIFAQLDMSIHDMTYDFSSSHSHLRKLIEITHDREEEVRCFDECFVAVPRKHLHCFVKARED